MAFPRHVWRLFSQKISCFGAVCLSKSVFVYCVPRLGSLLNVFFWNKVEYLSMDWDIVVEVVWTYTPASEKVSIFELSVYHTTEQFLFVISSFAKIRFGMISQRFWERFRLHKSSNACLYCVIISWFAAVSVDFYQTVYKTSINACLNTFFQC